MPIVNKQLSANPNILISTIVNPLDLNTDPLKSLGEIQEILNKTEGVLHIIADCREVHPSFSDVVTGMASTSREGSPLRNDRLRTVIVAQGEIFTNMAEWYKQNQYGKLDMPLFKTVDEAIAFVKQG